MLLYAVLALVGILSFILYLYERNQIFARMGVDGPPPRLLVGNIGDLSNYHLLPHLHTKYGKMYGPTYGFMEGGNAVLVTRDVDILSDVFNKKFSHFHGRKHYPLMSKADTKLEDIEVFIANGERWKRQRSVVNKCYTNERISAMYPMIRERVNTLINCISEKGANGTRPVSCHKLFNAFTVDVIAKIVFDDQVDYQAMAENKYTRLLNALLDTGNSFKNVAMYLPGIHGLVRVVYYIVCGLTGQINALAFVREARNIVKQRKLFNVCGLLNYRRMIQETTGKHMDDFLQYFLDTEADDDWRSSDNLDTTVLGNVQIVDKKLTNTEIVKSCIGQLFAGSDTSAACLSFTTMLLAIHTDAQVKMTDEIMRVCGSDVDISLDTLDKLPYMDACLKEALRFYPIASNAHNRTCSSPCTVGVGSRALNIPKGMLVQADTWNLHKDETYWGPDAHVFRPERWLADQKPYSHPMAYMPFGAGRRLCAGNRLAFAEMKIVLCMMLRKFTVQRCDETQVPIQVGGVGALRPVSSDVIMKPKALAA